MEQNNNNVPKNEELDEAIYDKEKIKNLIYNIRGKQVMLDSDVARLYHYETKRINETVQRNKARFPENFCFQLTEEETESLRSEFVTLSLEQETNWSQIATSSIKRKSKHRGKSYLPYAFTEQGIAMLSGLLKNRIAIQVSINIMNAFVEMRKFITNNGQIFQEISNIKVHLLEHDKKFDMVFNELQKEKETEFKQKIFFDGQIYDAYSLIVDIIKKAKEKILIVDNYIDDSILKMLALKNKNVTIVIITSQNSNLIKLDINKFNKQYPSLQIAYSNKFHDRFILIDNKELYHIGASLKDIGKKCFAINKIEDSKFIEFVTKIN